MVRLFFVVRRYLIRVLFGSKRQFNVGHMPDVQPLFATLIPSFTVNHCNR